MVSRRELIGKAAVGATAALALGAARTAAGSARALHATTGDSGVGRDARSDARTPAQPAEPEAVASPAPWELLSPLVAGAVVAPAWRVTDLSPVRDGSCVVTLQNEGGRAHRDHLCRNDGTPQGIVHTRALDLVMMNAGYGDLPTEESLAQAVAALAHVVAANESKVPGQVLAELLPHAERVRRFASGDGTPSGDGRLR